MEILRPYLNDEDQTDFISAEMDGERGFWIKRAAFFRFMKRLEKHIHLEARKQRKRAD